MKKVLLSFGFLLVNATFTLCFAQAAPTFTRAQQQEITKILGSDFVPVFSSKGELSIATRASAANVRALGGGFSKSPGDVASNILIHKGWILATSKQVLEDMKSKLGAQRFSQLEAVVSKR